MIVIHMCKSNFEQTKSWGAPLISGSSLQGGPDLTLVCRTFCSDVFVRRIWVGIHCSYCNDSYLAIKSEGCHYKVQYVLDVIVLSLSFCR